MSTKQDRTDNALEQLRNALERAEKHVILELGQDNAVFDLLGDISCTLCQIDADLRDIRNGEKVPRR